MFETMRRKVIKLKHYKTFILAIFSFLLGCMLTINLTPIDKTCRVEDTDREYSIMHNSKLKDPDLVILILSAPQNLDKRNIIRQTWLKFIDDEDYVVKFKMKHFFVIGSLALTVDEILHLSTEQSQFSDILILPIHDSYQNLALKVVKSFEWLNDQYDYGLKFKYVLKCDDDSFIRADKLANEIMNIESTYIKADSNTKAASTAFITVNAQINKGAAKSQLQLYWGYFNGNARVKTAGKWQEKDWIVCDKYVPYALGGGYLLSKKLVTFIAQNQEYLRYYGSEDVSVGLWLSTVTNILRIHDIRFDTEWISRGCQNYFFVTHNIPKEDMQKMYNSILSTNKLCEESVVKRSHYFYNWSSSPSQCCKVINN